MMNVVARSSLTLSRSFVRSLARPENFNANAKATRCGGGGGGASLMASDNAKVQQYNAPPSSQ